MIAGLGAVLADAEDRRRTIEVYAATPEVATEIAAQFETKNVAVTHSPLPASADTGFLVLRDGDGEFLGSIGLDALDRLLSPEIHPPWVLAETGVDYAVVFDFLDDTLFTSFDRSQMLATAREIEERAWRVAGGTLFVGFQRGAAFEDQKAVYEQLMDRGDLSIQVYVSADWDVDVSETVPTTVSDATEIGQFWFLAFDGAGADGEKCALIAEERGESFYGFWTYDPAIVDDVVAYLDAEYGAA